LQSKPGLVLSGVLQVTTGETEEFPEPLVGVVVGLEGLGLGAPDDGLV
jgi:hypothetical protein